MGSIRDVERGQLLVIRLSAAEVEMLKKLRKERNVSISQLVREALAFVDGDPHVC